ncbi:MAG: hypothetical protein R2912_11200 [Eubacteriales bacterium]
MLLGNEMPDFDDVYDAIAGSARVQGYVCAPALLQKAIASAMDLDLMPDLSSYQKNRDALYNGLKAFGYRCMPRTARSISSSKHPAATATRLPRPRRTRIS